jgi:hypothetical protein
MEQRQKQKASGQEVTEMYQENIDDFMKADNAKDQEAKRLKQE